MGDFANARDKVMEGLNISQRELAEQIGCEDSMLANLEKDNFKGKKWSRNRLLLLALYFGESCMTDSYTFKKKIYEELCDGEKNENFENCEMIVNIRKIYEYSFDDIFIAARKIVGAVYEKLIKKTLSGTDKQKENVQKFVSEKYPSIIKAYENDNAIGDKTERILETNENFTENSKIEKNNEDKELDDELMETSEQAGEMEEGIEQREEPEVTPDLKTENLNKRIHERTEAIREYEIACSEEISAEEGIKHLYRAAELGHRDAVYCLGLAHLNGKGVSCNPEKAVEYFFMAGKMKSADAVYRLKMCYQDGVGIEKSEMKAIWLLNILRRIEYQTKIVDISLDPNVPLADDYKKEFAEFVPKTENDKNIVELVEIWNA